jgi:putative ABC transport system permease protein
LIRLRAGVTASQAQSALDDLARRLERDFPASNAGVRFRVTTLSDMYTAHVRSYLVLLFAAVMLVLVVACANVANLLLSRAIARDREIAVRAALGAGRGRLLRQLLTESLVLSVIGAALGGVLALVGVTVMSNLIPVQLPPWMEITLDGRVGVFVTLAGAITGLLAGLVPAWRSSSTELANALKEGSRGSSDGVQHHRLRNALVVAEVAFALVLLVGASLLLQSVWRLQRVDLGFASERVLTFRVELGWAAYGTLEKTMAFHERVLERIRALPGVKAATFDSNLPLSGKPRDPAAIRTAGQSRDDETLNPYVHAHYVGPDYFDTMGIRVVRGRAFDTRDHAGCASPWARRLDA